jgi:branched-chain amino acid transport system ATP-binding protein
VIERLLDVVADANRRGTTVVLVEQSANNALRLASRAVFMEKGEVRFDGATKQLLGRSDLLRAVFLGGSVASRNGKRPARGDVRLSVTGLTKRYGGINAVDDVSVDLRDGEMLGVIGPNGAGKTTLFDLVTGLVEPDGGRVSLDGVDVTAMAAHDRARIGLGRSFQHARLWPSLTVREAIATARERHLAEPHTLHALFGLPQTRESEEQVAQEAEELIALLRLEAFRDKFVGELSTGSRRIVEIATILAHEPDVVLLDEPSSGIAQRETEALGPLLRDVRDRTGCAMLVIEHDMRLITSLADRIVALDHGRVIADGTPRAVLRDRHVIASYLGTPPGSKTRRKQKRRRAPARTKA